MSQKFIGLDDAAEQLGISKERLNELREAGELRAYRDGASWKFRSEEIDGFVGNKLLAAGSPPPSDAPLPMLESDESELDVLGVEPLGDGDDAESILLTEDELDGGLPRPPSTIIGKSELSLEDDLSLKPKTDEASDDAGIVAPASGAFEDLDELELDLDAESSRLLEGGAAAEVQSALSLAAESVEETPAGEEFELELEESGDSLASGSDVMGGGDDASQTGDLPSLSGAAGSIAGLSGLDSIEIGDDEQDDMVLGDSGDLSLASSDSGINLAPSDSGIALDEVPLDLGGSAIGSALDLASLSASVQEASPESISGSDLGVDLGSGEDFLLTPTSDSDSSEDSSQVVALEDLEEEDSDEGAFDPGMSFGGGADEDVGIGFESVEEGSLGGDFAAAGAGAAVGVAAATPVLSSSADTAFPVWIMALLGSSLLTMALCGLMALDLVQSMWAWDEPFAINSALMDQLLSLIGG